MSSPSSRTSAPKAAIWRSLSGLVVLAATTVTARPRREPLYASPCPRFPALAHTTRDAPCFWATPATVSVPRPLKLRTGLSVSTFSVTEHPSARPSGAHTSAGVSRNTGSISPTAPRTRSSPSRTRSRLLTATQHPTPAADRGSHEQTPHRKATSHVGATPIHGQPAGRLDPPGARRWDDRATATGAAPRSRP